jgi:hypothetical protein
MKRLGLAFVCFGMFLAGCGDHVENPSAGSNLSSHHLSKNDESTKQLHPSNQASQLIYDGSWRLDESDLRQFALTLAAQPKDNENAQSGAQEFLVGTWIALAIVADALAARVDCAASTNSDHQREIDPKLVKGACVKSGAQP